MSRDKFEEWFRKDYMSGLDDAGDFDEQRNCYVELSVHMAWKGWLAGRESMRSEVIPIVYGNCKSDNAAQRTVDAIRKVEL